MVNIRIKVGIGGKIINVDKDLLESILGSSAGDVIPDVVKTHEKFANPHLSYPEARLWDALARMLVGLKPCCALYPEFVGGNIVRIKVAFNDSIFEPGQAAVTSIWNKIMEVKRVPEASQKLQLLSMVMNMQEYKVVNRCCDIVGPLLCEVQRKDSVCFTGMAASLKMDMGMLFMQLQRYNKWLSMWREEFNTRALESYPEGQMLSLQEIINKIFSDKVFSEIAADLGSKTGLGSTDLSYSMIKVNAIIGELLRHHIPEDYKLYGGNGKETGGHDIWKKKYDEFSNGFGRAIQDVRKVVKYLPQVGEGNVLQFIENHQKLHAELAIVNARIKELSGGKDVDVDSKDVITHYVGVSKLACEQCLKAWEILGLEQYVRGGHGQLFRESWREPSWDIAGESFGDALCRKLHEYLRERVEHKHHRPHDVDISEHCAGVSDEDADGEEKQLTPEKHRSSVEFLVTGFRSLCVGGDDSSLGDSRPATAERFFGSGDTMSPPGAQLYGDDAPDVMTLY